MGRLTRNLMIHVSTAVHVAQQLLFVIPLVVVSIICQPKPRHVVWGGRVGRENGESEDELGA